MKKKDLATLAVIGISAGLVVGGCQQNSKEHKNNGTNDKNGEQSAHSDADMETFAASLSPEAKKKFDELDAHHKMMAMEMADQKCNGQNKCAGMGGCATADNSCAGQNGCEGEGGPPIKDSDKAVDVQYKNQMNGK